MDDVLNSQVIVKCVVCGLIRLQVQRLLRVLQMLQGGSVLMLVTAGREQESGEEGNCKVGRSGDPGLLG